MGKGTAGSQRSVSEGWAVEKQAAKKFPHLAALDAAELKALLKRSTLSREDRQIAVSCLIWDMNYADIAAAVHMDRTTVSRRMRNIVAPQLLKLLQKTQQQTQQQTQQHKVGTYVSGLYFHFWQKIL